MQKTDVLIIGAGLAGLTCGRYLAQNNIDFQIIEAQPQVGGRVQTDEYKGFLLDRGFQVFLPAYPEAQPLLDYSKLDLRYFRSGATVLKNKGTSDFVDPLKHPGRIFEALGSDLTTTADLYRAASLRLKQLFQQPKEIFANEEKGTLAAFHEDYQFSDEFIRGFLRPFYAGIFLEADLNTSRRMFEFVFKMFSQKGAAIPARGIGELAKQLAAPISAQIKTNCRVKNVAGNAVQTEDGDFSARKLVYAIEPNGLNKDYVSKAKSFYQSTSCLYFETTAELPQESHLILDSRTTTTNNISVISQVSNELAPAGSNLLSVTLEGNRTKNDEKLAKLVKKELSGRLNSNQWNFLKSYHIDYALPDQRSVCYEADPKAINPEDNIYLCGDYLTNGSQNGAMASGRQAAEQVTASLIN